MPEFQTVFVSTAVKDQILNIQNNQNSLIHARAASSVNHTQIQNMDQVVMMTQVIQKLEVITTVTQVPFVSQKMQMKIHKEVQRQQQEQVEIKRMKSQD